jgi:hypothetical protein
VILIGLLILIRHWPMPAGPSWMGPAAGLRWARVGPWLVPVTLRPAKNRVVRQAGEEATAHAGRQHGWRGSGGGSRPACRRCTHQPPVHSGHGNEDTCVQARPRLQAAVESCSPQNSSAGPAALPGRAPGRGPSGSPEPLKRSRRLPGRPVGPRTGNEGLKGLQAGWRALGLAQAARQGSQQGSCNSDLRECTCGLGHLAPLCVLTGRSVRQISNVDGQIYQ